MSFPTLISLVLTAGLAIALAQVTPSSAQNTMSNTSADCSKADSKMMQPDSSMQSMSATGDIDKDYANMMVAHNKVMMGISKAEIACGKDTKTKAMAQKAMDQETRYVRDFRDLLSGGH